MRRLASLLPLVVLSIARCGGGAHVTTGSTSAADAGLDGAPPPAPAYDPDAAAPSAAVGASSLDACASGEGGDLDPPDPQGLDTNCDGADGIVNEDVYVSIDLGADTNPGTPSAPMRTLAAALTLAATRGGNVLALNGTYPVDAFTSGGTWAIYGGYPTGFVGQPNRQTTVLTASATGLLVQNADRATLAHLTVQGDMPSAPTEPTAHALRTSASKLLLLDVLLQAGDGLSMAPAPVGASGANGKDDQGPLFCNGVQQPAYTSGACCGEGSVEGKQPGSLLWSLRAQGSPGTPGGDGDDANGTVSLANGLLLGDVGEPGSANGTPGFGAATGGANPPPAGTWTPPSGVTVGPFNGGNGGSGGCPGAGGSGGTTGGASAALLVLGGAVTVQGSVLQAGLGGNGGNGGQGGAGGAGGQGTPPSLAGAPPLGVTWPTACTPTIDPLQSGCAEYGGIGGAGGAGGNGGGGGGGWTFGVVTLGAATCSLDASSTVTLGEPGSGGVGNGGGRAPNGKRSASFHLN